MKKKNSPSVSVLKWLAGALFMTGAAFAAEPPVTLISYAPVPEPGLSIRFTDSFTEETNFSPPSDEELKRLDGELELLVFTTKEPGVCSACDRARSQWKALMDEYPITPVYCSMSTKPRVRGDVVAREYDVEAFPTFVLVVRNCDGSADEISRWRGSGSFLDSCEKRIKREFAEANFKPRIERGGVMPPFREPRPIPGLKPQKPPKEEPGRTPPRVEPPGRKPGKPRFKFEVEMNCIER